jgi:ParB family chromosome partitioning protein
MARKGGLGRGLEALIPTGEPTRESGLGQAALEDISPNPRQPRSHFDETELQELAESIKEHGLIQPLVVAYAEQEGKFTLIAGERRWLAAQRAGLKTAPVVIRAVTDQQRLELALIENIQRADLNALEEAEAYRQLVEEFSLSHEAVAARVGKSRTAVTNTLRLLKLPVVIQKALLDGKISAGHARALLALNTPQAQAAVLNSILQRQLSVRQTEELVERLKGEKPQAAPREPADPQLLALEERLQTALGTRVELAKRRKGWTLTIHSYSDEELDALLEKLLGESGLF